VKYFFGKSDLANNIQVFIKVKTASSVNRNIMTGNKISKTFSTKPLKNNL
jgi:hypothetical protein